MKKYLLVAFLGVWCANAMAQVKFVARFEVEGQAYDPIFEMMRVPEGLVSFRTYQARSFSTSRVLQYYISDQDLKSTELSEVTIRPGFDMVGYDTDGSNLYVLMGKGYTANAEKYILHLDLTNSVAREIQAQNLLDIELVEFLVQKRKAIFMGSAEGRPVLQMLDLDDRSVHTAQGIYGNNTNVLQIRKLPELEAIEVVIARKGQYRNRETSIITYDMLGNLVREVKIDQFGDEGQEILEGFLLSGENYQQVMIGAFGLNGRSSYQGMYIMEINEFGEYEYKLYTLEDFPNFFNYLEEKQKLKRDKEVLEELEKSKTPSIRNTYSIRDVRQTEDAYFVYFDQINLITGRNGRPNNLNPINSYRYDRLTRMGYAPYYMDPFVSPNTPVQAYNLTIEYEYVSSHFIKVSKAGQILWDNSANYKGFITSYPEPFGEVAVVGDDVYHLYAENDEIKASFFRNGERIFQNESFELAPGNESERINFTDRGTLRLVHWYDRYFLLTGLQTVRYLGPDGREKVKDVFFMSKILVDGDLYQREESPD